MQVKQAIFIRDVNQAMNSVVFAIDKMRYREDIINKQNYYRQYIHRFEKYDSINRDIVESIFNADSSYR